MKLGAHSPQGYIVSYLSKEIRVAVAKKNGRMCLRVYVVCARIVQLVERRIKLIGTYSAYVCAKSGHW